MTFKKGDKVTAEAKTGEKLTGVVVQPGKSKSKVQVQVVENQGVRFDTMHPVMEIDNSKLNKKK